MTRFIRNSKGQVAIFIALMFQVLFLFFAMIINVGLLVHHKINLQNSVDLAAYYGASKQAEVLNAISHVNYQIRQSWKLLLWRQKVLGTAGAQVDNSVIFPSEKLEAGLTPQEQMAGGADPYQRIFVRPTFCITYAPFEVAGQRGSTGNTENTCKNMWENVSQVTLPSADALYIPGFFNFGTSVAASIRSAATQAFARCSDTGALNYVMGSRFVISHYIDADERAFLMNYLATGISTDETNFYELSGDLARVGLEKTLRKNLTAANNADVSMEMYNSLAAASCRNTVGTDGANPPQWLVPIRTYPVWRYLDCASNNNPNSGNIQSRPRHLIESQRPANTNTNTQLQEAITEVSRHMVARTTLVGFEKDPWCVPYVGVRATARPKIPFMPISDVAITAQAYAKPFGGRIGPWYVKDWPQAVAGAARESYKANARHPDMVETNGTVRVDNISNITGIDDPNWSPNVSRFPGDILGFSSERVLAFFHSAINDIRTGPFPPRYTALTSGPTNYPFPVMPPQDHVSYRYFDNVATGYGPGQSNSGPKDQLSWDTASNAAPRLRLLEIAAIAPTIYDLNYYSIEPNFYDNYLVPIRQHIQRRGRWEANKTLLGDYGWRADNSRAERMNIFDQIKIQRDVGAANALNSDVSMPYVVKTANHLLNSWAVDNLLDYRQNSQKFGNCFSPSNNDYETPISPATPGNCVDGGRVGNSVKLVSKEWLTATDLELGGPGLTGAIRNPPPW